MAVIFVGLITSFRIDVLKEYVDISDGIGIPDWQLTICLLVSWMITYGVCVKGVLSSGKASYFLALFPYVVLLTLLIRATTLEGSGTGIWYFINPEWEKLLNAKVFIVSTFFSTCNLNSSIVGMV